jgi:hypothetical protein
MSLQQKEVCGANCYGHQLHDDKAKVPNKGQGVLKLA